MAKFKFITKKNISRLPRSPGVYLFKNKKEILYIGKAANLGERLKNHFQQPGYRDNLFIDQVQKIGYLKTGSEIEALILEANLIKKHQPKYNVVWRDDKNYFYVGVTKEDFPRIFITHQTKPKFEIRNSLNSEGITTSKVSGSQFEIKYVGPFVDGRALKTTLASLRKIFPFRTCKSLRRHSCLWCQLGRCPAPCQLGINQTKQFPFFYKKRKKECQENTKNLLRFLQGKKKNVLSHLKKQMREYSKKEKFEKAAKIRNQITALEKILAHSKVLNREAEKLPWSEIQENLQKIIDFKRKISRIEAYDVSNIQGQSASGAMITFINGQPEKNLYRRFKIKITGVPNDTAMIKETLTRRFSHQEWGIPEVILIDGGKAQLNAAIFSRKQARLDKKIKIIALAKKKNEFYIEGKKTPLLLEDLPREIFNLILKLRDEAHRFAISYHRKLRKIDLRDGF